MCILIAISFSLLIISPISTVAIGIAIGVVGLGAGAANIGVTACTAVLVISSLKINKGGITLGIALGGMKMMMPNLVNYPIIAVPVALNAALCGIAVRIFNILGTPQSAGFGVVGLVGPITAYGEGIKAGASSPALILGIVMVVVIFLVHPIFLQAMKKYDKINSDLQENINAVRVVKAYVRENYEINKFKNSTDGLRNTLLKAEKIIIFVAPAMQFCMYSCIILLSWFGAKKIVAGNLTTGQLMSLFSYTANILMSLLMFAMVIVTITFSRASGERIVEVLDEEPSIKNIDNPVLEVIDGSISFENVNFSYSNNPEVLNLENINLHINQGETIGIIGGTGSAKSALVQLIPRLYDVLNGEVKVGGVNVKNYDIKTLRDNVAMVLQKNVLFSGTIKENLMWGNKNATEDEMIHACKLAQADEFIQRFPDKYDTYIEQGGSNVSGGQKQRLCIARALLKNPKILILDDSTSAVDTKTDKLIREAFKNEIPDITKIIIAQRISSVKDADKIIVLDDGKISGIGVHEELIISNSIYKEVHDSQEEGGKNNE